MFAKTGYLKSQLTTLLAFEINVRVRRNNEPNAILTVFHDSYRFVCATSKTVKDGREDSTNCTGHSVPFLNDFGLLECLNPPLRMTGRSFLQEDFLIIVLLRAWRLQSPETWRTHVCDIYPDRELRTRHSSLCK